MTSSENTISVAVITKNESTKLASCLDSVVGWVNEIVIYDSGSEDNTLDIARRYTDRVFTDTNWEGFGRQRQKAQEKVTSEFVLWLDADEVVTPKLKESVLEAIAKNRMGVVYACNRKNFAFGKAINHSGWSPDWVVRLYRISDAGYNEALVHEKVLTENLSVVRLDGRMLHDTYSSLHHYLYKTTKYIKAWTDEREGKKSGVSIALIHAFASFLKMYILRFGFLDGRRGFILAWLTMNSTFVKYIDLYLREQSHLLKIEKLNSD